MLNRITGILSSVSIAAVLTLSMAGSAQAADWAWVSSLQGSIPHAGIFTVQIKQVDGSQHLAGYSNVRVKPGKHTITVLVDTDTVWALEGDSSMPTTKVPQNIEVDLKAGDHVILAASVPVEYLGEGNLREVARRVGDQWWVPIIYQAPNKADHHKKK